MPSSVNIQGLRLYKPGIYAIIDASSLGGSGISTGNVAVVGSFPTFPHGGMGGADTKIEPLTFTNSRAVMDYFDNEELLDIAKTAFSPSTDSRVPGGANSLTFVNATPNSAASSGGYAGFFDVDGTESLVLTSRLWGTDGNRVLVKMATNATDAWGTDVEIFFDGKSEQYVNLQSGVIAELYYDGADITRSSAVVGPAQWLWKYEIDTVFPAAGGAQSILSEPVDQVVQHDSELSVKLTDGGGASTADVIVTIIGLDELGGSQTAVLTAPLGGTDFGSGAGAFHSNGAKWSRLDSITIETADAAYNGTVTLEGTAFDLDTTQFDSIGSMCTLIDNNAAKGFHADGKSPRLKNIPASPDTTEESNAGGADSLTVADVVLPAKMEMRSNLHTMITQLDSSDFVSCKRAASGVKPPRFTNAGPAVSDQTFLFGGAVGADTAITWELAFKKIEASDVQIVVPWSEDVDKHKMTISHCINSAIAGYERNGWCGADGNKSLTELFDDYSAPLNSRHVALVGQKTRITNSRGLTKWKSPKYLAMRLAGMQAGTPVATPLTWKRPDVLDVAQEWDANLDSNEAIAKGICVLSRDTLGWRVERSVTTHLEDDNPIYSEVSSMESVNSSVRDLRAKLLIQIGNPVFSGTATKMKSAVEARLDKQVKDGLIKAYQNVFLEDLGDTIRINYEVAALEPLNFIVVVANVVRISST